MRTGQYGTGLQGETLAEEYLCRLGMSVIARRFRGQDGEVDLIMLDGETVVFPADDHRRLDIQPLQPLTGVLQHGGVIHQW